VVEPTHMKHISQNWIVSPNFGVNIKKQNWNHHPVLNHLFRIFLGCAHHPWKTLRSPFLRVTTLNMERGGGTASCSRDMFSECLAEKKMENRIDLCGYVWSRYGRYLVGGFNPLEKYYSNWESSPRFGVKIKNLWNHQPNIHTSNII